MTKGNAPSLAVVVLSFGAPDVLVEAVRSVLAQQVPVEVLVINSGGGNARALLLSHGIDFPVIEFEERLFVGAARNCGIRATRAPIVAFLASDCLALPGWVANRIEAHRSSRAVASSLVTSHPDRVIPWAAHLSLFARRLPGASPKVALAFGASYDRALFDKYGLFREDLRASEDYEFHRRLPTPLKPVICNAVRTVHRNPTHLAELVADQFRRGNRAAAALRDIEGSDPRRLVRTWWRRIVDPIRISSRALAPAEKRVARWAWVLLPIIATAYCLGLAWPKRLRD
jgi:glycosyltransferase involved in cell wall biosynthesis